MSWIRCSGSSFACAALGCERAGDVNQLCMGAVMGRSVRWKLCEAVAAEAVASAAGVRRAGAGVGVRLGMGGYTTTLVSRMASKQAQVFMASMLSGLSLCLRLTSGRASSMTRCSSNSIFWSALQTPTPANHHPPNGTRLRRVGPLNCLARHCLPQNFGH